MRLTRRTFLAGVAAAATPTVLASCSAPDDSSGSESAGQSEMTVAGPIIASYDPMNGCHLFFTTGQAVYDPLVMVSAEGVDPQPWLAESFEVSEDGHTISFKLHEDVKFVDGTHLDAPGLEKYLNSLFASKGFQWKLRVADQSGAKAAATGKFTLDITLTKQPVSYQWWWQFGLTPIASPAIVDDPSLLENGPCGSGPYLIDQQVPDVSVTYKRNPDYWNTDKYPFDKATLQAYDDQVAVLNAVKTGQLDAGQINIPLAQEAQASKLTVTQGPGNVGTIYIADHNGKTIPALGDKRVRHAIAMAFDRAAILAATNLGFGSASSQQFAPGQAEYVEGGDDRYPYDVAGAKALMAEAGYAKGFDVKVPTFPGVSESINGTTNLEPIAQTSLAEIGINVTYEPYGGEAADYIKEVVKTNKYPMYLRNPAQTNWIVDFDEVWGPYDNAEFKALLKKSREGTPSEQTEAQKEIGKFFLEEAWYVSFSRPAATMVSVAEVAIQIDGAYTNPKLWQYTAAK